MTNRTTNFPTLIMALMLISGAAQANQTQQPVDSKPITKIIEQESFVSIPSNTKSKIDDALKFDRDFSGEFGNNYISKIEYDVFGNIDANIGVITTKNVKSRYRVRPAKQPRGRYFKSLNSKLGAGISSKF